MSFFVAATSDILDVFPPSMIVCFQLDTKKCHTLCGHLDPVFVREGVCPQRVASVTDDIIRAGSLLGVDLRLKNASLFRANFKVVNNYWVLVCKFKVRCHPQLRHDLSL